MKPNCEAHGRKYLEVLGARPTILLVLAAALIPLLGCGHRLVYLGPPGSGAVAATPAEAPAETTRLMIFGGPDHKTYLGCLNCSEYAADSVLNEYGQYGSPYAGESIWNEYGQYGSAYSQYGVCNAYASDPPVIVDEQGNAYGRLTVNEYNPNLGLGGKYLSWLKMSVCK